MASELGRVQSRISRGRHSCSDSVSVVGAGFSGILAAYRLALSGYPVCLIDMDEQPGGVMKDDVIGGIPHLSGCHVIQSEMPEEYGFKLPAREDLVLSPNRVSSVTWSNNETCFENGIEGPISSTHPKSFMEKLDGPTEIHGESLADRIERYPEEIRLEIEEWTGLLSLAPGLVHQDSLEALQLRRVFFPSRHAQDVRELKGKNSLADDLFGVAPTRARKILLPMNGYSAWFASAINELRDLGVHYLPNRAAKPIVQDGRIHLRLGEDYFCPSVGIWCANPTPLAKALMPESRWDGQSHLLTAWHVEIDDETDTDFNYVQFFGHPSGVIRATQYQFGGVRRALVESLATTRQSASAARPAVLEAARKSGVIPRAILAAFTRRSYLTVSMHDRYQFRTMGQRLHEFGWAHSGLHLYSRSKRLAWLNDELRGEGASPLDR